jgi:hypothetical protein
VKNRRRWDRHGADPKYEASQQGDDYANEL